MKWPQWEPRRDEYNKENPDKAIAWAIENAIRVRGHCLFWAVNGEFQIPNWIKPLTGDDLREAIDHRVTTAVTHFDVRILTAKLDKFRLGIIMKILPGPS